jgi:cobyrinic acid a,c-diamide synthase
MHLDAEHHLIKGIILNKMSKGFYESIRTVMEKELNAMREDVRVLGFFPKNPELGIESRHLGLKLPGEIADIKNKLSLAAAAMAENVDIDAVLEIMKGAPVLEFDDAENGIIECRDGEGMTLAVASDEAFCFYYKENLEMFEKFGVRLTFFSPIKDEKLPEDADGLLFGGGYPENYLMELSANKPMLESIKNALASGLPSLAECGGFMYLHRKITDKDGTDYEMVGAIDGECHYTGRLVRFGYMEIEAVNAAEKATALEESLVSMKGHEFHYYDSTCNGDTFRACKPTGNRNWNCIIAENNGIWGFPHFYYGSDPEFVKAFISRMKEVKNG